jgi:hypothetical protein
MMRCITNPISEGKIFEILRFLQFMMTKEIEARTNLMDRLEKMYETGLINASSLAMKRVKVRRYVAFLTVSAS